MKSIKEYLIDEDKLHSLQNYIIEADDDPMGDDTTDNNDDNDNDNPDDDSDNDNSDDSIGNEGKEKTTQRGNIKFTIWEEPDKKVSWLKDNEKYQKIEYKHEDKKNNIFIDFLLGYVKDEDTWKLWVGKIGAVNYDDDPYCDFETDKFAKAIVSALDKVEEFIKDVEDNPENWIQYYKDI